LVGDADLAEDLTQETFARALISLANFRGEAAVQTWINRIAVNVTREHWRAQKRRGRIRDKLTQISELGDAGEELHTNYVDEIRSKVLYSVLDEIAPQLREAFILRDVMGFSTKEAAEQLGISSGNLAVRAHRARRKVQSRLAELGWLDGGLGESSK
jgi:RNA polymerase sigma-70 factor (ECF subfamily)